MYYIVMSAIVGLLMAIAFSSFFNFFALFAICFAVSLCILMFFDTIAKEQNCAFKAGCALWVKIHSIGRDDGELIVFFLWCLYFSPALLFILVAIVGGMLTAPFFYFVNNNRENTLQLSALVIAVGLLLSFVILGIILFFNPFLIYSMMHFGWVIALFIVTAAVCVVLSLVLWKKFLMNKKIAVSMLVTSILLVPIMAVGIVRSLNTTYWLYNAEDFHVLANAPTSEKTLFVLTDDIDFTGKDTSWYGVNQNFYGVFEGRGHKLTNINVEMTPRNTGKRNHKSNPYYGIGFVLYNGGIIKNVTFENCKISILSDRSSVLVKFGMICCELDYGGSIENCNVINCQYKFDGEEWKNFN